MNAKVRPFEYHRDLPNRQDLVKDCFPENRGTVTETKEYYLWKFHSIPGLKKSHEYAAYVDDKIVGYYAAIPYKYNIRGQTQTCGMVCDVMTHSSWQRKGIFTKLSQYAAQDLQTGNVSFTIGYPIRREVLSGHLKIGWNIAFALPMYIKLLKSDAVLETKGLKHFAPLVNIIIYVYSLFRRMRPPKPCGFSMRDLDPKDLFDLKEYDVFFAGWSQGQAHFLVKDRRFLRWRLSSPATEYKVVAVYEGVKMVAVAILRDVELKGVPCMAILDLMVLPGKQQCLKLLHQHIEFLSCERKLQAVAVMLSKTWCRRYRLVRNGFIRSPFVFKLIMKPLSDPAKAESFCEEKNWHLMWVDSDNL